MVHTLLLLSKYKSYVVSKLNAVDLLSVFKESRWILNTGKAEWMIFIHVCFYTKTE